MDNLPHLSPTHSVKPCEQKNQTNHVIVRAYFRENKKLALGTYVLKELVPQI